MAMPRGVHRTLRWSYWAGLPALSHASASKSRPSRSRRLTPSLRTKFDSMDVVQSVWADVLGSYRAEGWQLNDRDHLRAFLARVTYNHFFQHCRRHGPALVLQHLSAWRERLWGSPLRLS